MMLQRRFAIERLTTLSPVMLVSTGLVLIAGGLLWPTATSLHGSMSTSAVDFIQGFLVGIGIPCEIMGLASILSGRGKRDSPLPRD
jgi:hypothetical protein